MAMTPQTQQNNSLPFGGYELPPEAGDLDEPRFEPREDWLRGAPPELQMRAMRRWFLVRYQDPTQSTPHDEAGRYLYTQGGPFRPQQVLRERFGALVDGAAIDELAQQLRREVGDEWAPRNDDPGVSS